MSSESGDGLAKLGVPVVLLSAIWGALDVVLKGIEMQNKVREDAIKLRTENRSELFFSDWVWLWLGTCWFLLLFTIVISSIPRFLSPATVDSSFQNRLCRLAATVPGLAYLGVLVGGAFDLKTFFPEKEHPWDYLAVLAGISAALLLIRVVMQGTPISATNKIEDEGTACD